jgi:nucleoside transporter
MSDPTAASSKSVRNKLFLMMLLEFFIWGAWLPKIFGYLPAIGFSGNEQLAILLAFPVAAILGMFFSNQFADRNFAAEKFMAFSHLISGLAILGIGFLKPDASGAMAFWPFFGLMVVHCLLYVPTMSIANSIAFTHMKDAVKDFGIVRMGGTIGWILAAWPFIFLLVDWDKVSQSNPEGFVKWLGTAFGSPLEGKAAVDSTRWTYIVAGIASLLLAVFSLSLPHTPPKKAAAGESQAWAKAFGLLKHPVILVLWIVTFIDAFVHNTYFFHTETFLSSKAVGIPSNWTQAVMSIGQVAEILTMFILGMTLRKLGWKVTMVIGILGHALRFLVYSFLPDHQWLIITVQIIHGICYAFYFATIYIYVDEACPKDMRTSAQGLFNLMIFGLGDIAAKIYWIYSGNKTFTNTDGSMNWHDLFLVPAGLAVVGIVILALFFKPASPRPLQVAAGAAPH